MAEECPPECKQDREMLHKEIEARSSALKWVFGILVVVLIAIFGVLYAGQRINANSVALVQVEVSAKLAEFRAEVTKELNELTKVVIRMDERAKLADDRIKMRELKERNNKEK